MTIQKMPTDCYVVREVDDDGLIASTIYFRKEDAPPDVVPLMGHHFKDEQSCNQESSAA